MELQLCEDGADDAMQPNTRSGSLYGLWPAIGSVRAPAGEWIEEVKRVCRDFACEHWFNGTKVASFDLASETFQAKLREAAADPIRSWSGGLAAAMMLRKINRRSGGPGSRVALQHHNSIQRSGSETSNSGQFVRLVNADPIRGSGRHVMISRAW